MSHLGDNFVDKHRLLSKKDVDLTFLDDNFAAKPDLSIYRTFISLA